MTMTRAYGPSRPLTAVLGMNCRRLRTEFGLSQDALAGYARAVGLPWNGAKIANFEAGRWTPTFADVLALGIALEHARLFTLTAVPELHDRAAVQRQVVLADLLESDEPVTVRGTTLSGAELADIGRSQKFPPPRVVAPPRPDLAEQRLAKALRIDRARLAEVSQDLWGATFTTERDRRAGAGNQQKRGRIARELRAELEKALASGHD